jgi:RNA polymerase sigma-70 factor, ECF subfamily
LNIGGGSSPAFSFPDMTAAPLAICLDTRRVNGNAIRPNLLRQARRGNREAFAEMVTPFMPSLYRRAHGLTGNPADAEDIRQETLLKAWSKLEQFTGNHDESEGDFRAWISRIASNSSIDMLRQRRGGQVLSLEEPKGSNEETVGSSIAAEEHDPEELCARREMARLLASAILTLPRDLRQACLLRDVLHYSTEEVASRLRISTVAVRLRLFRAHRRLREKLQERLQPHAAAPHRNAANVQNRLRIGFPPLSVHRPKPSASLLAIDNCL